MGSEVVDIARRWVMFCRLAYCVVSHVMQSAQAPCPTWNTATTFATRFSSYNPQRHNSYHALLLLCVSFFQSISTFTKQLYLTALHSQPLACAARCLILMTRVPQGLRLRVELSKNRISLNCK